MRSRMCNACRVFSPVDDWGYGCPQCGHGNGRAVSYSEYPGVQIVPDIGVQDGIQAVRKVPSSRAGRSIASTWRDTTPWK